MQFYAISRSCGCMNEFGWNIICSYYRTDPGFQWRCCCNDDDGDCKKKIFRRWLKIFCRRASRRRRPERRLNLWGKRGVEFWPASSHLPKACMHIQCVRALWDPDLLYSRAAKTYCKYLVLAAFATQSYSCTFNHHSRSICMYFSL